MEFSAHLVQLVTALSLYVPALQSTEGVSYNIICDLFVCLAVYIFFRSLIPVLLVFLLFDDLKGLLTTLSFIRVRLFSEIT